MRAAFRRVGAAFFGEIFRTAAAETVNRLFYVAHQKHVFAADGGKQFFLHGIDVLIFVHENVRVFFAQFASDGFVF